MGVGFMAALPISRPKPGFVTLPTPLPPSIWILLGFLFKDTVEHISAPCVTSGSLFFFNVTAPTEIYTLSLHDALPISGRGDHDRARRTVPARARPADRRRAGDRKSTRLNSSHTVISYAVFCLKKK